MSIGENIKNRRQDLGMTLEQVADRVALSRQTLSRYETGVIKNIPSDKIELLATVLDTTPMDLMGWNQVEFMGERFYQVPVTNIDIKADRPTHAEIEIGDKIRMLRKQLNMTLEDVGNIVGVGKSTVRKWENGDIPNMRRDKIAKLAAALDTTPGYLMGWDDDKENPPTVIDEGIWAAICKDPTKLDLARWVAELDQEQLTQVAKVLAAILDREIPPSALD